MSASSAASARVSLERLWRGSVVLRARLRTWPCSRAGTGSARYAKPPQADAGSRASYEDARGTRQSKASSVFIRDPGIPRCDAARGGPRRRREATPSACSRSMPRRGSSSRSWSWPTRGRRPGGPAPGGRDSRAPSDGRFGFKVVHPTSGERKAVVRLRRGQERGQEAEREERLRLYYVAMTRAIDRPPDLRRHRREPRKRRSAGCSAGSTARPSSRPPRSRSSSEREGRVVPRAGRPVRARDACRRGSRA